MQTSKYLKRLGNLTFTEFNIYQKRVLVRTENNLQNIGPPSRWKLQIKFSVSETEMGPKFWFSWISPSSKEKRHFECIRIFRRLRMCSERNRSTLYKLAQTTPKMSGEPKDISTHSNPFSGHLFPEQTLWILTFGSWF